MTAVAQGITFLDDRAKARAAEAVKAFETHTSAELVITVKKTARAYPEAELASGATIAFASLLFLLFFPVDFATSLMPIDVLLAFMIGFALARTVPWVRRRFVSAANRRTAVEHAAKLAFVDLGVSRTTGRTGVLVFVAHFEGLVAIVTDFGVSDEAKKAAHEARATLEAALGRSDMSAFADALEALGPRFGKTMARAADDVNELPDEVV